jgi:putative MATE family efflux protein
MTKNKTVYNANSSDFLGTADIKPLMWKLAIPAIVAQIVNMLYNMVDRIYIGHIPGDGALALTGLGVAFSIIIFISAFGNMIAMGAAPKSSIALGKKDTATAEKIVGNSFSFIIVVGLILTILTLIFKRKLLFAFGASNNTIEFADKYIGIYAIGTISVLMSIGMNAFISAQGFTSKAMQTVIIGAVINVILDPIFIFGLKLGVQGAAYATIISQTVSALWVLYFLTLGKSPLKLRLKNLPIDWKIFGPCLGLGQAPFIMTSTESALIVVFNSNLLRYGGDVAVGTMTIISSLNMFSKMPIWGFDQGAQPVIGYNFGAKNKDRMIEAVHFMFKVNIICTMLMFIAFEVFPSVFVKIFTSDPSLIAYSSWALRIYLLASGVFGLQGAVQYFMVSTGQAKVSASIALLRKIVLLIPLIYILPHFFENSALGVFVAEPAADFISVTYALIMYKIISKRIYKQMDEKLT